MTTTDHLEKILAKCREKIAFANSSETALAGWHSTIAAIEGLSEMHANHDDIPADKKCRACAIAADIIVAWPKSIL